MILKDLSQDDLSTFVDVLESRQDEYFANSVTSLVDNVKDVPISKPEIRYLMGESLPLPEASARSIASSCVRIPRSRSSGSLYFPLKLSRTIG